MAAMGGRTVRGVSRGPASAAGRRGAQRAGACDARRPGGRRSPTPCEGRSRRGDPPAGPCLARRARASVLCCASGDDAGEEQTDLVYKPQTPAGEMLAYYLSQQPHLFQEAVDEQLQVLQTEKEQQKERGEGGGESSEMVLFRRMEEVRDLERKRNLEDVIYYAVVEKFTTLGISMLSPLDDIVDIDGNSDLESLTSGVHSIESLEMVRSHLMQVLAGPGGAAPPNLNAIMKISKLQAAQVYAASVMFGYFLRRVDARFQLEKTMGMLDLGMAEDVDKLEKIFSSASADESWDEDLGARGDAPRTMPSKPKSKLQQYIESFDQQTLQQTAQILSGECGNLVERQTRGLFGDITLLQEEMQKAMGTDPLSSPEELMQRLQSAVVSGEVRSLTLTVAAQRRIVLEAVAFGAFLRDMESYVAKETVGLLTANSSRPLGP